MNTDKQNKNGCFSVGWAIFVAMLAGGLILRGGDWLVGQWKLTSAIVIWFGFTVMIGGIVHYVFFGDKETTAFGKVIAVAFLLFIFGMAPVMLIVATIDGLFKTGIMDYSDFAQSGGLSRSLSPY